MVFLWFNLERPKIAKITCYNVRSKKEQFPTAIYVWNYTIYPSLYVSRIKLIYFSLFYKRNHKKMWIFRNFIGDLVKVYLCYATGVNFQIEFLRPDIFLTNRVYATFYYLNGRMLYQGNINIYIKIVTLTIFFQCIGIYTQVVCRQKNVIPQTNHFSNNEYRQILIISCGYCQSQPNLRKSKIKRIYTAQAKIYNFEGAIFSSVDNSNSVDKTKGAFFKLFEL